MDYAVAAIKQSLTTLLVEGDGIKYERIGGKYYQMSMFEEEQEIDLNKLYPVTKLDKTLFNYVLYDSEIEHDFARDCEAETAVKFFVKLPSQFEIPTPVGMYRPDWAVVFENDKRIYFVVETKSTFNPLNRRINENIKIKCGKLHFELAESEGVVYRPATHIKDLYSQS